MFGNDVGCEPDGNSEIIEAKPDASYLKKQVRTRPQIFTATSGVPKPLSGYKPFMQQVGGHLMVEDDPCFMLDENGHLLKLLEEKSRKEKTFYEIIFIKEPENKEWSELRKYLPRYYGTVNIFNGTENLYYLKMDNLVGHLEKPCIMDLKIGKKTFDPFAGPDKIQRELIRYKYQAHLGFRITGFKVYKAKLGKTELYDRFHCKCIKPDDVVKTLAQFFDLEDFPERKVLISEMIQRLKSLLKWFEKQTRIKFYRTSLLIAYDGNVKLKSITDNSETTTKVDRSCFEELKKIPKNVDMHKLDGKEYPNGRFQISEINDIFGNHVLKERDGRENDINLIASNKIGISMIDFAHTFLDLDCLSSSLDDNYMFGLKSVIEHLEQCRSL